MRSGSQGGGSTSGTATPQRMGTAVQVYVRPYQAAQLPAPDIDELQIEFDRTTDRKLKAVIVASLVLQLVLMALQIVMMAGSKPFRNTPTADQSAAPVAGILLIVGPAICLGLSFLSACRLLGSSIENQKGLELPTAQATKAVVILAAIATLISIFSLLLCGIVIGTFKPWNAGCMKCVSCGSLGYSIDADGACHNAAGSVLDETKCVCYDTAHSYDTCACYANVEGRTCSGTSQLQNSPYTCLTYDTEPDIPGTAANLIGVSVVIVVLSAIVNWLSHRMYIVVKARVQSAVEYLKANPAPPKALPQRKILPMPSSARPSAAGSMASAEHDSILGAVAGVTDTGSSDDATAVPMSADTSGAPAPAAAPAAEQSTLRPLSSSDAISPAVPAEERPRPGRLAPLAPVSKAGGLPPLTLPAQISPQKPALGKPMMAFSDPEPAAAPAPASAPAPAPAPASVPAPAPAAAAASVSVSAAPSPALGPVTAEVSAPTPVVVAPASGPLGKPAGLGPLGKPNTLGPLSKPNALAPLSGGPLGKPTGLVPLDGGGLATGAPPARTLAPIGKMGAFPPL